MKIRGGYAPEIAGKPAEELTAAPAPQRLIIPLTRAGLTYTPTVQGGESVLLGQSLAQAEHAGGVLHLPAPAAGAVKLVSGKDGNVEQMVIDKPNMQDGIATPRTFSPDSADADNLREALAIGGVWPLLWSSKSRAVPPLDGSETPNRMIVNCVSGEPFRANCSVILAHDSEAVLMGLDFLPRLMASGATVHVMIAEKPGREEQALRDALSRRPWVRIETIAVRYPVEHPEITTRALHKNLKLDGGDTVTWALDVQALAAVGACLGSGMPLHRRIVAVGGPAAVNPHHVDVRIGTPVAEVVKSEGDAVVLRGGLMTGVAVDPAVDAVAYDDNAFFVLARPGEREFLSFVQPGFDRVSVLPLFGSRLTGAPDRHITTALRGELRPCIACGLCESLCPAGLLPQVLHRYLYRSAMEEAEAVGLHRCIRCGICAYVCPSKINLVQEFTEAQEQMMAEHAEASVEAERQMREQNDKQD